MKEFIHQLLPILTLAGDIFLALAIVLLILARVHKSVRDLFEKQILPFFNRHLLLLMTIVAGVATLGSLFYSDIMGYTPCKLCWYQRIFMYPQFLLLGMAYYRKDRRILPYSLALSIGGLLLAVHHYTLQRQITPLSPCSAIGYSVSCSDHFVLTYGYITIPVMAATAFLLLIGGWYVARRSREHTAA